MTKSATCLWKNVLRAKNMRGYSFKRERPILNYIVDFVCLELLLVIEVDGISHITEEQQDKDVKKDKDLTEVGFTVMRFGAIEVLQNISFVAEEIAKWIDERVSPPPHPLQRGTVSD